MRISDSSSDVCSSDLLLRHRCEVAAVSVADEDGELVATEAGQHVVGAQRGREPPADLDQHPVAGGVAHAVVHALELAEVDRKSVVAAKGVSARADPGGRRILNKKKKIIIEAYT